MVGPYFNRFATYLFPTLTLILSHQGRGEIASYVRLAKPNLTASLRRKRHEMARLRKQKTLDPRLKMSRMTEGGKAKTLDPRLLMSRMTEGGRRGSSRGQASRMTEGEKQILRFAQNDQWQEWVVVMQSRVVLQEGLLGVPVTNRGSVWRGCICLLLVGLRLSGRPGSNIRMGLRGCGRVWGRSRR